MINNETLTKIFNNLPAEQLDHYEPLTAADRALTETLRNVAGDSFAEIDEARNELDQAARESGFILGYLTALKHTESAAIKDDRDVILADIKSTAAELSDADLKTLQTVIKRLINQ